MNVHELNHIRAQIDSLIDQTLEKRVMKAGAEGIRSALFMHLERAARADIDTKFTAEHRQILLRFSMPAAWTQAQAKLEEVGRARKELADIVRRAVQGDD